MATSSSVCVEASEKECSVCNKTFIEPKLLPCGHLLCQHCVLSRIFKKPDASCPLCKYPIVDSEKWGSGEIDFEAFADSLPTDLAMKALVDAERILYKRHRCQGCKRVAATAICLHCGDFFCHACTKIHKNMSSTKHHVVEEMSSLTPEKLAARRWEEQCAVHADKASEVFCPKHGTSICILCATTDHRECRNVTLLEKKKAQKILKELAATLNEGEARLERGLSDLEQHMLTMEKKTQAAIAEIEHMCNRLEFAVKACRSRLKDLVQSTYDDVREAVNGGKGALFCRKGNLMTHKRALERAQGMTSRSDATRMTQALQARVKELVDFTVTMPTEVTDLKEVTLTIDAEMVAHIEQLLHANLDRQNCADIIKKFPTLAFHHNHGDDVVLSNNQLTAEKQTQNEEGSLVLAQKAMVVNRLYEVRVDKLWEKRSIWIFRVGVLTSSPDAVTIPTKGRAYDPTWSEAIVLHGSRVDVNGKGVSSDVGQALFDMPVGSRVGLSLNDKRDLLLYRDGQLKGTITTAVPDPAYPLFHVDSRYKQVTALPVSMLK